MYATAKGLFIKLKQTTLLGNKSEYPSDLMIAAFGALLCWSVLPVIVFFGDFQVLEHSVTNAGFLMMTLIYIRTSINQSRIEYEKLLLTDHSRHEVFDANCKLYHLTPREIEIVTLIIKGQSYKIVGSILGISEKTVGRHVSNIFIKVSATNKIDLINKLEARDQF
jgi:DNA-binding CsgD family transcriptional regulator